MDEVSIKEEGRKEELEEKLVVLCNINLKETWQLLYLKSLLPS